MTGAAGSCVFGQVFSSLLQLYDTLGVGYVERRSRIEVPKDFLDSGSIVPGAAAFWLGGFGLLVLRKSAGRSTDGKIHTDSKTKIITVLLYMNDDDWPSDGGRLRILRDGKDLENYAAEVEPKGGTLIVFKRSDKSWHGHHSYEGPRRAIQLNWVLDQGVVDHEQGRHNFSTRIKKIFARA